MGASLEHVPDAVGASRVPLGWECDRRRIIDESRRLGAADDERRRLEDAARRRFSARARRGAHALGRCVLWLILDFVPDFAAGLLIAMIFCR